MSIKVALIARVNDLLCTQHRINMEAQLIQLTCTSSSFSTFALMFRSKGRNKGRYVTLSFDHFTVFHGKLIVTGFLFVLRH